MISEDMGYYFLSYSSKDTDLVDRICHEFDKRGLKYWRDKREFQTGTDNWLRSILKAIADENCMGLIAFATPNFALSDWTTRELVAAQDYQKRIIPIWCSGNNVTEVMGLYNNLHMLDARALLATQQYEEVFTKIIDFVTPQNYSNPSTRTEANQRHAVTQSTTSLESVYDFTLSEQSFVYVPAGEFSREDKDSAKTENLREFYIGTFAVTRDQFEEFVKDTKHKTLPEKYLQGYHMENTQPRVIHGATWQMPYQKAELDGQLDKDFPVTLLAYQDMIAYCAWLTSKLSSSLNGLIVSLPTPSQWEKAAKGGHMVTRRYANFLSTKNLYPNPKKHDPDNNRRNAMFPLMHNPNKMRMYPWGDEAPHSDFVHYGKQLIPCSVLKYDSIKYRSPYGCVQMSGNVREACLSNDEMRYIVKGGSFLSAESKLRCNTWDVVDKLEGWTDIGFRIVLNPPS